MESSISLDSHRMAGSGPLFLVLPKELGGGTVPPLDKYSQNFFTTILSLVKFKYRKVLLIPPVVVMKGTLSAASNVFKKANYKARLRRSGL